MEFRIILMLHFVASEISCMRTTLALDEDLVAEAQGLTGVREKWFARRSRR